MSIDLSKKLCVGVITGAHGVRGSVRIKSFTANPKHLANYGKLASEDDARSFSVTVTGKAKGGLIAQLDCVKDRDEAEALKGVKLFISRDALPDIADEDEFYHADLIGLSVQNVDGEKIGSLQAIFDFGSGDVLEIRKSAGGVEMLPFTKDTVPFVNVEEGIITVDFPDSVFATAGGKKQAPKDLG